MLSMVTSKSRNGSVRRAGNWQRETVGASSTLRYRGQPRRGNRGKAVEDDGDLRIAVRELESARHALADARALPPTLPRHLRDEAINGAVDKIRLAARLVDDVIRRCGG